jgi:uncharacterized membrane protein YhaH (DUF805 family)
MLNGQNSVPTATTPESERSGDKYEPCVNSTKGRIGRLRYIAYTWVAAMVLNFYVAFIAPFFLPYVARNRNELLCKMIVLVYAPNIILGIIMARRRLQDLNRSGWWLLVNLIPFAVIPLILYLLFAPGTDGPNKFGPKPIENPPGTWIPVTLCVVTVILLSKLALTM